MPFPPHVKALLQVKQIRDDMLPHLHLAWVGGFFGSAEKLWRKFKRSAIPAVSHLTIGFTKLFFRSNTKLCGRAGKLLRWMRWRSQRASRYRWNLRHLTLIEGSHNWPSNPCHISHAGSCPRLSFAEGSETVEVLVENFPMPMGLRTLKLVLVEQLDPVLLNKLSKRCEAHGIDVKVTVQEK